MSEKPEGPIWIDMGQMLSETLTVQQLVWVANRALNCLTMREIGKICGEVGLSPTLELKGRDDE